MFDFSFQVYTSQKVEYSSGKFFGNENGTPTRTLLSFFVSSVGGNYDDMVCLIPIVTLKWPDLMGHTSKILDALKEVGFNIVAVIVDGHKTNVRFFSELCKGDLCSAIPHPICPRTPLHLVFDPVHLFKNFYNNFERYR
jgi:hypothetical protein